MSRCTTPLSTFTLNFVVQPSSGVRAQPSPRPMVQLCSGQATLSPNTMPWLSGPPLCGQRSSRAKTLSSALRKIATSVPWLRETRRAPSTGMSSTRQIVFQLLMGSAQFGVHAGDLVHHLQDALAGGEDIGHVPTI